MQTVLGRVVSGEVGTLRRMRDDTNSTDDGRSPGWADADKAWSMIGSFVSGPLAWGGIGWLLDNWLDTGPWLMTAGVVLGFVLGFYLVIQWGGGLSPTPRRPQTPRPSASRTADGDAPAHEGDARPPTTTV